MLRSRHDRLIKYDSMIDYKVDGLSRFLGKEYFSTHFKEEFDQRTDETLKKIKEDIFICLICLKSDSEDIKEQAEEELLSLYQLNCMQINDLLNQNNFKDYCMEICTNEELNSTCMEMLSHILKDKNNLDPNTLIFLLDMFVLFPDTPNKDEEQYLFNIMDAILSFLIPEYIQYFKDSFFSKLLVYQNYSELLETTIIQYVIQIVTNFNLDSSILGYIQKILHNCPKKLFNNMFEILLAIAKKNHSSIQFDWYYNSLLELLEMDEIMYKHILKIYKYIPNEAAFLFENDKFIHFSKLVLEKNDIEFIKYVLDALARMIQINLSVFVSEFLADDFNIFILIVELISSSPFEIAYRAGVVFSHIMYYSPSSFLDSYINDEDNLIQGIEKLFDIENESIIALLLNSLYKLGEYCENNEIMPLYHQIIFKESILMHIQDFNSFDLDEIKDSAHLIIDDFISPFANDISQ